MSLSWVTVKPSSSNSSVTDKLILIDYGCCGGISVSVGGHAMGICARGVGCVGLGGGATWGYVQGWWCWGGATWGYVQGWWGVGGGATWGYVQGLGGCYMGICARGVGCVGVGGVLHGDMCKGGGVGGVLHGDMCKGVWVLGGVLHGDMCKGGGVWGVLHALSSGFVLCC